MAILINHSFKYKQVNGVFDCDGFLEVCAIETFINGESLLLVSCYRPLNSSFISEEDWLKFFNQFNPRKVIFGGDFNAHNINWGSSHTCPNGEVLWRAVVESDLSIVGDSTPTYCGDAYRQSSILDLTFAHNSLSFRLSRSIESDTWGSDHFPILIELPNVLDRAPKPRKTPKLYSTNTDWSCFQKEMDRNVKSLFNADLDVESIYSSFIASVERAAKLATPRGFASSSKKGEKVTHPPCPWWNGECDRWVRLRKAALSRFRCTGRYEHFVEYRRQVAVTRKELRRIKRESFRGFCEGLRRDTNPSYVWNTIKKFDYRWNRTETDKADKIEKRG